MVCAGGWVSELPADLQWTGSGSQGMVRLVVLLAGAAHQTLPPSGVLACCSMPLRPWLVPVPAQASAAPCLCTVDTRRQIGTFVCSGCIWHNSGPRVFGPGPHGLLQHGPSPDAPGGSSGTNFGVMPGNPSWGTGSSVPFSSLVALHRLPGRPRALRFPPLSVL